MLSMQWLIVSTISSLMCVAITQNISIQKKRHSRSTIYYDLHFGQSKALLQIQANIWILIFINVWLMEKVSKLLFSIELVHFPTFPGVKCSKLSNSSFIKDKMLDYDKQGFSITGLSGWGKILCLWPDLPHPWWKAPAKLYQKC